MNFCKVLFGGMRYNLTVSRFAGGDNQLLLHIVYAE